MLPEWNLWLAQPLLNNNSFWMCIIYLFNPTLTSQGDVSSSLVLQWYMNILTTLGVFYTEEDALRKAARYPGSAQVFEIMNFCCASHNAVKANLLYPCTDAAAEEPWTQIKRNIFAKLSLWLKKTKIQKWTQGSEKHCPSWACETHPPDWKRDAHQESSSG